MSYELTELLQRCTHEDAEFIIANIDSYINFTDDKGLKEMLGQWTTGIMPLLLAQKIEKELRYLGSSDVAYAARKLRGLDPAGVSTHEILEDVSKVLKIRYKNNSSLEIELEYLAKGVFEKTFLEKDSHQQIVILQKMNFSKEKISMIESYIKNTKNSKIVLPVLIKLIGKKATSELVETLIFSVIKQFLGRKVAAQMTTYMTTRCPWIACLGPAVIALLTGWTALDLCSPAMRKTIPILLHLSTVSLRNGVEDKNMITTA